MLAGIVVEATAAGEARLQVIRSVSGDPQHTSGGPRQCCWLSTASAQLRSYAGLARSRLPPDAGRNASSKRGDRRLAAQQAPALPHRAAANRRGGAGGGADLAEALARHSGRRHIGRASSPPILSTSVPARFGTACVRKLIMKQKQNPLRGLIGPEDSSIIRP
jgi:hypothetical protein